MQAELSQLNEERECLDKKIFTLERAIASLERQERQARGVEVPWKAFSKAAMECVQAWKYVDLAEEDQEGACEGCDESDDDEKEYQWGHRRHYELRPIAGCPALTVCSWCLKKCGPENALEGATHKASVRVDPNDYDGVWKAYLIAKALGK